MPFFGYANYYTLIRARIEGELFQNNQLDTVLPPYRSVQFKMSGLPVIILLVSLAAGFPFETIDFDFEDNYPDYAYDTQETGAAVTQTTNNQTNQDRATDTNDTYRDAGQPSERNNSGINIS